LKDNKNFINNAINLNTNKIDIVNNDANKRKDLLNNDKISKIDIENLINSHNGKNDLIINEKNESINFNNKIINVNESDNKQIYTGLEKFFNKKEESKAENFNINNN
jgi:hypothetical protein